ncbi:hypothetical protein [Streptomyces sp. A1136]|nr:hypothetical protein [Streptomyces sp. A1136]
MTEPLRNELTDRGTGADALGVLLIEDGPAAPTRSPRRCACR